ncbi:penicillin-binding protein 2 [Aerococcaceae bacterium zg-ZJ1578]|uniref:peptidoglycan D,D-transpeptidase FtsI family protein n=1 Tax=Aerococcaceae TaxID=186827 RepID=UPI0013B5E93D|nr:MULTISPECIES: penicillin-binding protein 2 [unclassified Facklamia]MBK0347669.1 penicillin-binding protein 2 [Aerococcaceae bacterium zg-1578]MBS4461808.1 penicillin-binding protein 2 [Aerococcaceae bacterium zg-B36]QQD66330.1 penicillin-binding protein 2 [Aerococcaceae bacterium zg-252]NEW63656.1 penicillin-binding protein 2 [Facklamia sp. 252]NEW67127.1 penicillin-binding protein 2 [Facklamia sp. 253]
MAKYKLKKNKNKSHIPRRLNLLFVISFLCFVSLFIRLGYLQLYRSETFLNMVQRTDSTVTTGSVPRGMIYDSQGRVLVGNHPEMAILYTRDRDSRVSPKDIIDVARKLASLIEIPTQNLTERDLKDYFIVTNESLVNSRLTREQKQLSGAEVYKVQLDAVTSDDLVFSEGEKKVIALFKNMNSAYALSTVTVKNQNVTQEEIARVSEQLGSLPGISIGTDWQRTYPQNELLRSILGQVSTEQRGLPSETAAELLAKGYALNDRVGISYLEKQYEDVLRGSKSISRIVTDASDDILSKQKVFEGAKGNNLVLSVDAAFNEKLDQIAENALRNMQDQGLNDRIYIVAMNPNTGDILGITGKRFEYDKNKDAYTGEIIDDTLGAINTSYGMGSSVKPAMVSMGYLTGVISTTNNVITDEPMKFQASQEKSSVFNRTGKVDISDIEALEKSSNIYMIKMAMMMGGQTEWEQNGQLTIANNTIDKMRNYFAEFGLGTNTGIDLPNESTGYSPEDSQLVSALDLSYGQFDLYTPLQMAQYVSTIANGGVRYAPRLVKEIRNTDANGELGGVITSIAPKIMNVVQLQPEQMARIHQGMYQVSHSQTGTARYLFLNYPIKVGSKTGTTEAFYSGPIQYAQNQPVTNATYIGFAPYDKPEIAISVIVPYLLENASGRQSTTVAHEVMNAYFETQSETKDIIAKYKAGN